MAEGITVQNREDTGDDQPSEEGTARQTMGATSAEAYKILEDSDDVFADLNKIFTQGKLIVDSSKRGLDMKDKQMVEVWAAYMQLHMTVLLTQMEARVARTSR